MAMATNSPWKHLLLDALQTNAHLKHSSFFQLATVGCNGRPANRTLVFRGFHEGSQKIEIYTDSRSHKVDDLKRCPFGEICWYFTDTWEQFRINGKIEMIDSFNADPLKLHLREKAWFASSLKTRIMYLGCDPGRPYIVSETPNNFRLEPTDGPVDTFCLLVLDPEQVDYLNLKRNERVLFRVNPEPHEWIVEKINP
ncbi:Pyridoxine/pyridoxamine 5'-phosphate oxidase 2 [Nymphaea thermarum]|nr:Pyridoxine/pyridoxamine 5'-phosphate oxidase 2 [Nymphaea thermarum]